MKDRTWANGTIVECGGYVTYRENDENGKAIWGKDKFIARFKYQKREIGPFVTFLRKNFTPGEYFARMEAGESPAAILESYGYFYASPALKRELKKGGYPVTKEGWKEYRMAKDISRTFTDILNGNH